VLENRPLTESNRLPQFNVTQNLFCTRMYSDIALSRNNSVYNKHCAVVNIKHSTSCWTHVGLLENCISDLSWRRCVIVKTDLSTYKSTDFMCYLPHTKTWRTVSPYYTHTHTYIYIYHDHTITIIFCLKLYLTFSLFRKKSHIHIIEIVAHYSNSTMSQVAHYHILYIFRGIKTKPYSFKTVSEEFQ